MQKKNWERHLISATFYATYWGEVLLHQLPDSSIGFRGECSQSPRGLEVWYREKNKALQVLMPTNTQRADALYSCFACVMWTASCWKLSLPAQLQEQFCVRGVHSPSAVPTPATAVARSLLVFHAVSSDLIRIGLWRPPTPLTRVTDQQSFIFISSYYFPISSVPRIPSRNQTETAFSTFCWSYFCFSLWNNTEPRTLFNTPCLTHAQTVNFTRQICFLSAVLFLFLPYFEVFA